MKGQGSVDQALDSHLPALKSAKTLYLAFSGGLDSTVLFHLLLAHKLNFTVLHVNHGLSPSADRWQSHCEALAAKFELPFLNGKVEVDNCGEGLEDAARTARYEFFAQQLAHGDILLTAHHANDQAETLLFRLLRGSGLRGLTAIPETRSLGSAQVLRPLLNHQRQELLTFAKAQGLQWFDDESNENQNFSRNFLRHDILPRLQTRWPNAVSQIVSCSELLSEEAALLQEYSAEDLQECDVKCERVGKSLALDRLRSFSERRQAAILREWFRQEGYRPFSRAQYIQIIALMASREDAQPVVKAHNWQVRRFNERLYLFAVRDILDPTLTPQPLNWHSDEVLDIGDAYLHCVSGPKVEFSVTFRRGGERCCPRERQHSTTLKNLLQEYSLEPWWRDRVPLIYYQNEMCAVGDLFVCDSGAAWQFRWEVKG